MNIVIKHFFFKSETCKRSTFQKEPLQQDEDQNASWADFNLTHASVLGPTLDDLLYWLAPMLGITGPR